jgi:probable HAF family extracellular repeat protein
MFNQTISLYSNHEKVSAENKATKTDWGVKWRQPLWRGVCSSLPLLLGLASPGAQAALPEYVITDLGTFGGLYSSAYDINNNGQVVGTANLEGDKASNAFLWTPDGGMRDLGTLGGAESEAKDISPDGQVVGMAGTQYSRFHAFLWKDGVMRDIDDEPESYGFSGASGINARGHVVGSNAGAFLWSADEGMKYLGFMGASAINGNGQAVGSSDLSWGGDTHAYYWTAEEGARDIGTLVDFNNSGASDINNGGQVVGSSYPNDDRLARAFLWTAEDGMQDLNAAPGVKDSGWKLDTAKSINDAGQIVGRGDNPDGESHAFLLTPVKLLCQGRVPTVLGGAGNDVLKGTARKDVIQGRGGNDTIQAGAGNDIVCGGAGNDKLYGGTGKNKLSGGSGKDTCKQGVKRSGCER